MNMIGGLSHGCLSTCKVSVTDMQIIVRPQALDVISDGIDKFNRIEGLMARIQQEICFRVCCSVDACLEYCSGHYRASQLRAHISSLVKSERHYALDSS